MGGAQCRAQPHSITATVYSKLAAAAGAAAAAARQIDKWLEIEKNSGRPFSGKQPFFAARRAHLEDEMAAPRPTPAPPPQAWSNNNALGRRHHRSKRCHGLHHFPSEAPQSNSAASKILSFLARFNVIIMAAAAPPPVSRASAPWAAPILALN